MFGKSKPKSLADAESTLGNYAKIQEAIERQVAGLPPLIQKRLDSEKQLADAKAGQAMGEPADVPRAQKQLQGALAMLEERADLLRGLRSRLLALSVRLAESQQHLSGDLPEYEAELKEAFAAKWQKAFRSFELLLGERQALEGLLGGKLDLSEPSPASFDVAETSRPHEVVKELQAAVQDIGRMAQVAAHAYAPILTPGASLINYNSDGVYVLRRATRGLTEGTVVVDCSFSEGRLKSLVEAGWASNWKDPQTKKIAADARRAELAVGRANNERAAVSSAEYTRELAAKRKKFLESIGEKEYDGSGTPKPARMHPGPAAQVAADRAAIEQMIDPGGN